MDYLSEENFTTPLINTGDPEWLEGLNEQQREAVLSEPEPLLVLAGAGTGKTRVLTTRLAWLLYAGYSHLSNIYCVTFTNKAAGEMVSRIQAMLPQYHIDRNMAGVWLGTFHAMGAKMLRIHACDAGLQDGFIIIDTDDQIRLIREILASENVDDKRNPAKLIAHFISQWKDSLCYSDDIMVDSHLLTDQQLCAAKIYPIYQQRMVELNAVDFGDLLIKPIAMLQQHEQLLQRYRQKFQHILVDEYQDTNKAQYQWLKLLAGVDNPSITCVGDDDQSIYGWRGADINNILCFERDFKNAHTIKLEQNYRSRQMILKAAGAIVANNQGRLGKNLWTADKTVTQIYVRGYYDAREEAQDIAVQILRLAKSKNYNDFAILVRTSSQTRQFEEALNQLHLPYRLVGNTRFYEREEIRDAVAYLRLVRQQSDNLSWSRIINKPARAIGKVSQEKIIHLARQKSLSYFAAGQLASEDKIITGKAADALKQFNALIMRWQKLSATMPNSELTRLMLDESGYHEFLQHDTRDNVETRISNLQELAIATDDFDNLNDYCDHIALVTDRDEKLHDAINIMTIHAAKGLEFDVLFLPGWEEGLFPIQRALDEGGQDSLEEERRLAYVAITRAKENLMISCCQHRMLHGQWLSSAPSRFLRELPDDDIIYKNINQHLITKKYHDNDTDTPLHQKIHYQKLHNKQQEWHVGDICYHLRFGCGHVIEINGELLTVSFHDGTSRKLIASFLNKEA